MSNEELVAVIQAGASERMGELWQQVERLVSWKVSRVMTALNGRGGVEFEDLYHSGYPAMVAAGAVLERSRRLTEELLQELSSEARECIRGKV